MDCWQCLVHAVNDDHQDVDDILSVFPKSSKELTGAKTGEHVDNSVMHENLLKTNVGAGCEVIFFRQFGVLQGLRAKWCGIILTTCNPYFLRLPTICQPV